MTAKINNSPAGATRPAQREILQMKYKTEKTPLASKLPKVQRHSKQNKQIKQPNQEFLAPQKLKLLFTVVSRKKAEFYADFIQSFDVNMQLTLAASGTASTETLSLLGLTDSDKSVIISVIKEDKAQAALKTLEEKFRTIKNGKGIAYTVPMTGTIGVATYKFFANISE